MQAKNERFEMRMDQETIDRVDTWRSRQIDLPSKSEGVRRLIDAGLSMSDDRSIRFSPAEKLTIMMLCELYKHLDLKGGIDPEFVEEAIYGGHYWALRWELSGIFHGHVDDEATVTEVTDILEMWWLIEAAYSKFSKAERERVKIEAEPFGEHVEFRGFDANNEPDHFGIATFLVQRMDRFSEFYERDLNSHAPSLDAYRRMLQCFRPMRRNLGVGGNLSVAQIVELLKERTHPDYKV